MTQFFRGYEVVKTAVRIEINGETYYRKAAEVVGRVRIKDMFIYLADEEVKHRKTYEKMLTSLENYNPPETYTGEFQEYLKAFAQEHIFVMKDDIERMLENVESDIKVIDMALNFEKDSILFYLEMMNVVPENEKPAVDKIINEEHTHYLKLTELKRKILH